MRLVSAYCAEDHRGAEREAPCAARIRSLPPYPPIPLIWLPSARTWAQSEDCEMLLVLQGGKKFKIWLPNMKLASHWPVLKYTGTVGEVPLTSNLCIRAFK